MVSLTNLQPTIKRKLETAAVKFAASIHEAERAFLYAAWFDPAEMLTVSCDLGLDHSSISDPVAQFIFCYLGASAEFNRKDTISVGECVHLAAESGIPINAIELRDDILLERERYPGDIGIEIRPRGEILKRAVQNKTEARRHLRAVRDLIGADGLDELLCSRTNGARTRKRRRNPRKAVTYVG